MGQCFLYGSGGGAPGMKIVAGLTAPVKPKENMIWVETDKAGKDSVFAETEPETPAEGLIWFTVKKFFGIITKTKVYTEEAWVEVGAYMYLSGAWVPISSTYMFLYKYGDLCSSVSGGWGAINWRINSGYEGSTPSLSKGAQYMVVTGGNSGMGMVYAGNSISMANYTTLTMEVSDVSGSDNNLVVSTASPSNPSSFISNAKGWGGYSNGQFNLDVQNFTGNLYVALRVGGKSKCTIHACYLH